MALDGPSVYYEYQIVMRKNAATGKTLYMIHGSCHVKNVDMTKWPADNKGVKCQIGFYYKRDMVDWLTLSLALDDNREQNTTCTDGNSQIDTMNSI